MGIRTAQLIEENNKLVKEIDEFHVVAGNGWIIDDPDKIIPQMERYLEIQEILRLNERAIKQREVSEIRNFTKKYRSRILKLISDKCEICGFSFQPILQVHHIIPLSEGGGNELDNLSVLCPTCHHQIHYIKNNKKNISEWARWADEHIPINQVKRMSEVAVNLERGIL